MQITRKTEVMKARMPGNRAPVAMKNNDANNERNTGHESDDANDESDGDDETSATNIQSKWR